MTRPLRAAWRELSRVSIRQAHGIEPLVTISHYELPYYLVEKYNGWASRELVDFYFTYGKCLLDNFHDKVKYWLTFNEINIGTMPMGSTLSPGTIQGYTGTMADVKDDINERYNAPHHQFLASAKLIKYAHETYPGVMMGNMDCFILTYALTCDPADQWANLEQMRKMNWYCSDVQARGAYPYYAKRFWEENGIEIEMEPGDEELLAEGKIDFYTYSYYQSNTVTTHEGAEMTAGNMTMGGKNPYLEASDWGWQNDLSPWLVPPWLASGSDM